MDLSKYLKRTALIFGSQVVLILGTPPKCRSAARLGCIFKTDEVYLAMEPKAKKAEFFSLATAIQVKGTFTDYKIGVQPGGLIGTTIRFITSPLVVPIQRIFTEGTTADGRAACAAALHRSHD